MQFKNRRTGSKTVYGFFIIFYFEKDYGVLKSKS